MRYTRACIVLVTALATGPVGCSGDDGGDEGGSSASGSGSGSTDTSASTGGTGTADSASGSGDASGSATSGGDDTSAGEGGGTGAMFECGEQSCVGDEVCVYPCCGGAPPTCFPVPVDGCLDGQMEVDASRCDIPCGGETCCLGQSCTPPPPYCVAPSDLSCEGVDCSIDDCIGVLDGQELGCLCA